MSVRGHQGVPKHNRSFPGSIMVVPETCFFFGFWPITLATSIVQSHNAPCQKAEEQPAPSRGVATLCDLQNRRYRPPKMTRRTLILIPCIFPDLLLRNQKKRSQWRIYCPILMKFFLEHSGTIQVKMYKSKWVVITKKNQPYTIGKSKVFTLL